MLQTICGAFVDWSATGTMLQGIGTVIGGVAVLIGAEKAANTWREQKRAERRMEMAEKIVAATYNGRRALRQIRSPMMMGYELTAAENKLKEDEQFGWQLEDRKKRLITAQAYYNRLNATKNEQLALDECLPMARALFNEELEKAIDTLSHQFWMVQVDVDCYIDDDGKSDPEFSKKIRRGMYDVGPTKDNEVSAAIKESVSTIERLCAPALRLDADGKRSMFLISRISSLWKSTPVTQGKL